MANGALVLCVGVWVRPRISLASFSGSHQGLCPCRHSIRHLPAVPYRLPRPSADEDHECIWRLPRPRGRQNHVSRAGQGRAQRARQAGRGSSEGAGWDCGCCSRLCSAPELSWLTPAQASDHTAAPPPTPYCRSSATGCPPRWCCWPPRRPPPSPPLAWRCRCASSSPAKSQCRRCASGPPPRGAAHTRQSRWAGRACGLVMGSARGLG